jgi:adenylate cyclase
VPRNVEIKARIASIEALAPRVAALATEGPVSLAQDDTFFPCDTGRLKLRTLAPDRGELIHYQRADDTGPTASAYVLAPSSAPDRLREALTLAYGQAGRVRKRRTLYLIGRTRVHLDRVEGLGDFLELEVVLAEGEPAEAGDREARALLDALGIAPDQLVAEAYVDLLAADRGLSPTATGAGSRRSPRAGPGAPPGTPGTSAASSGSGGPTCEVGCAGSG